MSPFWCSLWEKSVIPGIFIHLVYRPLTMCCIGHSVIHGTKKNETNFCPQSSVFQRRKTTYNILLLSSWCSNRDNYRQRTWSRQQDGCERESELCGREWTLESHLEGEQKPAQFGCLWAEKMATVSRRKILWKWAEWEWQAIYHTAWIGSNNRYI